ncbi:MAG TPA: hypothetical protein VH765_13020 [Xanthobacteraceae bacterium]|jgi:hypothetical protein
MFVARMKMELLSPKPNTAAPARRRALGEVAKLAGGLLLLLAVSSAIVLVKWAVWGGALSH